MVVAGSALAACGDSSGGAPAKALHSYDGPLYLAHGSGPHADAGAAGQVVHCRTWGGGASVTALPYAEGATTHRPEQALHEQGILDSPPPGLRVAAKTADRVLYVMEVQGIVKEAVIVHDGPATTGAPGWYVESWAACDLSEFPRAYADSLGVQVWSDSFGHPVSISTIQSARGPAHCHWQSMTVLSIGKASYVREPLPNFASYFAHPYRAHSQLPQDAVDTGYHRDHHHLWLFADRQVAYVGTTTDVEAWPREIKPLLCA